MDFFTNKIASLDISNAKIISIDLSALPRKMKNDDSSSIKKIFYKSST